MNRTSDFWSHEESTYNCLIVPAIYCISAEKLYSVIIQIIHDLQYAASTQSLLTAPFFMSLPSGDSRTLLRYL